VKKISKILVSKEATIIQAIKHIDAGALQILLVVDENERLLGSVTDGDIRRGVLQGLDMSESISRVMNVNPVTVHEGASRRSVLALMQAQSIHCIPIVNYDGIVRGLETETKLLWQGIEDTWVVLMAGGLGMRLRPLTENTPKPLLPVNGKPILEGILERFIEQGFRKFYMSVNYKAEMFSQHFGDGTKWGCKISYLHEVKRLGTAGALSLLPKENTPEDIIVMNGDLMTAVDFHQLLDFHHKTSSCATMCVRDYSMQVPYGVVEVDGHLFKGVKEKPAHRHYINAGIYVLQPELLVNFPENEFMDITDYFTTLHESGNTVSVFPMRENWLDIGDLKEYEKANVAMNDVQK